MRAEGLVGFELLDNRHGGGDSDAEFGGDFGNVPRKSSLLKQLQIIRIVAESA